MQGLIEQLEEQAFAERHQIRLPGDTAALCDDAVLAIRSLLICFELLTTHGGPDVTSPEALDKIETVRMLFRRFSPNYFEDIRRAQDQATAMDV